MIYLEVTRELSNWLGNALRRVMETGGGDLDRGLEGLGYNVQLRRRWYIYTHKRCDGKEFIAKRSNGKGKEWYL